MTVIVVISMKQTRGHIFPMLFIFPSPDSQLPSQYRQFRPNGTQSNWTGYDISLRIQKVTKYL